MCNTLMVAAIDLGTTFSGYAFSTTAEFKENPLNVNANQAWKLGSCSLKCPTCILFDHNKICVSFGYEAEDQYADVIEKKRENEYYFFKHFKMKISTQKDIDDDFLIEDENGKTLSAKIVFTGSIKALMNHLLLELTNRGVLGSMVKKKDISWVLTVPSIWTESAKKFMRSCAIETGIGKKLSIALEPEAASIYCQCAPFLSKLRGQKQTNLIDVGTKFMIVDIGGGTTDIVVQEKLEDGKLKYLCKSSGEKCGGTNVDEELLQLMTDVLGQTVITSFKKDHPLAYFELHRDFENMKQYGIDGKPKTISPPIVEFDKLCNENYNKSFDEVLKQSKHKDNLVLVGSKLRLSENLFLSTFSKTTSKITTLIQENLIKSECLGLNLFLLVGGFSESPVIQGSIKRAFADKQIIIPTESGTAVLKGAVIYGHKPDIIASRVVKYTYGISSTETYDPSKHDKGKRVTIDGVLRCGEIFRKLVTANTSVVVGEKRSFTFHTINRDQDVAHFRLFCSSSKHPKYVDETGCKEHSKFSVEIQKHSPDNVYIEVTFQFGLTELIVSAKQKGTEKESNITVKYS